jgi:hypothetical protein
MGQHRDNAKGQRGTQPLYRGVVPVPDNSLFAPDNANIEPKGECDATSSNQDQR